MAFEYRAAFWCAYSHRPELIWFTPCNTLHRWHMREYGRPLNHTLFPPSNFFIFYCGSAEVPFQGLVRTHGDLKRVMTRLGCFSIIYYNHLAWRGHSFTQSFPLALLSFLSLLCVDFFFFLFFVSATTSLYLARRTYSERLAWDSRLWLVS